MIIEGEINPGQSIGWTIPHGTEVTLENKKAIHSCSDCSEKDLQENQKPYYHIYHLKDISGIKPFYTKDTLVTYIEEAAAKYAKQKEETNSIIAEDMSDEVKPVSFAIWKPNTKKYPTGALILKFIEVYGGIRVRVVNNKGIHIPNGALFFINKNIRVYDHVSPDFGIDLIQNNRLVVKCT